METTIFDQKVEGTHGCLRPPGVFLRRTIKAHDRNSCTAVPPCRRCLYLRDCVHTQILGRSSAKGERETVFLEGKKLARSTHSHVRVPTIAFNVLAPSRDLRVPVRMPLLHVVLRWDSKAKVDVVVRRCRTGCRLTVEPIQMYCRPVVLSEEK